MESITVKASATSANLGAGFDVLGLALDSPSDIIEVEKADEISILVRGRGSGEIPVEPEKNTAGLVALAMDNKVRITIRSGIRPGSGLGSSAAPAAGTAVAINELFSLGILERGAGLDRREGRSGGRRHHARRQRGALHHGRPGHCLR